MTLPKISKTDWYVIIGYIVFILLFWFFGASPKMTKFTAFFGLGALTGLYALVVKWVRTILNK